MLLVINYVSQPSFRLCSIALKKKRNNYIMGSETHAKVPVINFSKETLKPGTNSWSLTCKEVRRAIEEYGTFLAIYDKVSEELEKAIYNAGKELFDLPIESKERNNTERTYHGYVGDVPVIPLHESTGIDNATTLEGVQKFTSLMWPNGNEKFRYKKLYVF